MTNLQVIVHPLVLLSSVDHFARLYGVSALSLQSSKRKRVVGVLLGSTSVSSTTTTINVTNSYAVPFEEDEKNQDIWFLDHDYHESMFELCRKVNARERVVGWYHSGPKLRPSDISIHTIFKKYVSNPVLVVIDIEPKASIPTEAYVAVEEFHQDGSASSWTFAHVPSLIGAEEAEEIGVEHLLRDIRHDHSFSASSNRDIVSDSSPSLSEFTLFKLIGKEIVPLSNKINSCTSSISFLITSITSIIKYLDQVLAGALPANQSILSILQDISHYLPTYDSQDWKRSSQEWSNDHISLLYVAALNKAITALHSLIDNKIENKTLEDRLVHP